MGLRFSFTLSLNCFPWKNGLSLLFERKEIVFLKEPFPRYPLQFMSYKAFVSLLHLL